MCTSCCLCLFTCGLCKYSWNEGDERKEHTRLFSFVLLRAGRVSISPNVSKHMQTFPSAAEEERISFRETSLLLKWLPCCWQNRGQRGLSSRGSMPYGWCIISGIGWCRWWSWCDCGWLPAGLELNTTISDPLLSPEINPLSSCRLRPTGLSNETLLAHGAESIFVLIPSYATLNEIIWPLD